jgi:hypothetical protein
MSNSLNRRKSIPEPSVEEALHKRALTALALTVFILMAVPLLNVKIGRLPIYPIDFPAFLAWTYAQRIRANRRYPLQGFVVFILIAAVLSELVTGIQIGTLLQPIYLIIRTMAAISLFFSTPKIVQSKSDLETVIKAGLAGAVITATLMIASSLPRTQGMVAHYIFSRSFLLPASKSVAAIYGLAMATRGQSLVGVSILSAAFLNTIWPLLFLLRTDQALISKWRIALNFATILMPIGVIVSYSRGAIAGLFLIVMAVVLLNSNKVRQPVVIGVGLAILLFSSVGWDSQNFRFDWLVDKTQYQLANPYKSESTTARLYSYTDPFQHVVEHPSFILLGQGFAYQKVSGIDYWSAVETDAHSVFGAAYYGYGMLAAIAYVLLLLGVFGITWKYAWRSKNDFSSAFARALLASLFGFSSWFILGHAAVSQPRGAMLLFFIFGLVAAQVNFAALPERVSPETKPINKFNRRSPRFAEARWNDRRNQWK